MKNASKITCFTLYLHFFNWQILPESKFPVRRRKCTLYPQHLQIVPLRLYSVYYGFFLTILIGLCYSRTNIIIHPLTRNAVSLKSSFQNKNIPYFSQYFLQTCSVPLFINTSSRSTFHTHLDHITVSYVVWFSSTTTQYKIQKCITTKL